MAKKIVIKKGKVYAPLSDKRVIVEVQTLLGAKGPKRVNFRPFLDLGSLGRADLVAKGIPARFVGRLAATLSVPKESVYEIVGVSRATVDRKTKAGGNLSAADSEGPVGLARLIGLVERIVEESGDGTAFDAGSWVADFLMAPSAALGGRRPQELMTTSDGRALVFTLVEQMQSGAYT